MKKLTILVLFCCGILLAAPVHAWQTAVFAANSRLAHQPIVVQPSESEGDRALLSPAHSAPVKQVSNATTPLQISAAPSPEETALQPFERVVRGAQALSGLFSVYRKQDTGQVYLEIRPEQLNRNFLLVATLESGIGEWGLFSGLPLNNFMFQLRRVQNQVQVVVPNTNFRTDPGDPQWRSVERSFSDSVLYTLPIQSIHPQRQTLLVELNNLLLGEQDLPGLTLQFPWVIGTNYTPTRDQSYISDIKTFPLNVEIEAVESFAMSRTSWIALETLPDPRSFNLTVRYSLSQLPDNNSGYRSRLADERIGYFVTAYQDLSSADSRPPFVRHIQRWHLEPQDATASLSPPKEPIVFWIENTVPTQYRDAIREGVLMWNAAFEQAGLQNAIEVRQMPDNADWSPADVRYNTIRWSNSFANGLLGIGPSRANPLTGEILDADIIIDANAVRFIQENSDILVQDNQSLSGIDPVLTAMPQSCGYGMKLPYLQWMAAQNNALEEAINTTSSRGIEQFTRRDEHDVCFGIGSSRQAAIGALSLSVLQNVTPSSDVMQTYVHQFLRWLIAHEVGHVLGLRHNFRGSTMLPPEELHDPDITRAKGLVGSVMDYVPVNLAPEGSAQGDYFPTTLGPYDYWAIAYGYKTFADSNPRTEARSLQALAQRAAEPGLDYATDEDVADFLDTEANLWDLSGDMLHYSQWQFDNARAIWAKLERRYPLPGGSYSELRDRFNTVFSYYMQQAFNTTRYIGGQRFNRDRRGDPGGRAPFEFVPIEKQRQALGLLQNYVFEADAFAFSPDLINRLAPSRWLHWGATPQTERLDYPIYDNVLFLQTVVLSNLLSSERLSRLRDAELRAQPGEVLTLPELFDTLQASIWTEVIEPDNLTTISSLRRGLQRQYLDILVNMTLRNTNAVEDAGNFLEFVAAFQSADAPEDARVLARYQLRQLRGAIARALRRGDNMDTSTRAHLEEAGDRVVKALDAPL